MFSGNVNVLLHSLKGGSFNESNKITCNCDQETGL